MTIVNDIQLHVGLRVSNKLEMDERYIKAIEMYFELFDYLYEKKDREDYFNELEMILTGLIYCAIKLNEYKKAMPLLKIGIECYIKINNNLYKLYILLGECYIKINDIDNALENYLFWIQNLDKITSKLLRNKARYGYSYLMIEMKKKEEAIEILKQIEYDEDNINSFFNEKNMNLCKKIYKDIDFNVIETLIICKLIFEKFLIVTNIEKWH